MNKREHKSVGKLIADDINRMLDRRCGPVPKVSCDLCKGTGFCPAPGSRHGNKFCICAAGKAEKQRCGCLLRALDAPSPKERRRRLGFPPPTPYQPGDDEDDD
ncbi:MAG: hypothetical protein M5U26_11770 [Planctomycetota bacterium]|nr:hypothetical protein [Planctomycetota bacterium]